MTTYKSLKDVPKVINPTKSGIVKYKNGMTISGLLTQNILKDIAEGKAVLVGSD